MGICTAFPMGKLVRLGRHVFCPAWQARLCEVVDPFTVSVTRDDHDAQADWGPGWMVAKSAQEHESTRLRILAMVSSVCFKVVRNGCRSHPHEQPQVVVYWSRTWRDGPQIWRPTPPGGLK